MSLPALTQAAGLMPTADRLLTAQDVPPAPPTIKSPTATHALSPPPVVVV